MEKSQGEIYRLRAKLENTQSENENIQEEFDKIQQALSRSYAERDKYAGEMDKLREELERVQVGWLLYLKIKYPHQITLELSYYTIFQGAAGKYQVAQEKTQLELDKAHQEIDILREKMERNTTEGRRVSFCLDRGYSSSV